MKKMLGVIAVAMAAFATGTVAQELADIALPAPHMEGGKPLRQALKDRQSARAFSGRKLPLQVLSDLLWAANGINRPDSGKRTAPSAKNWQEIDVYVVTEEGAYLYDAKSNRLKAVARGDWRKLTGTQDFVAGAPLNLVYVADTAKMTGSSPGEQQTLFAGADAGFIGQNVYLFCASEGLDTVVRASMDRPGLTSAFKLSDQTKIILAQTVGYPADGR